MSTTSFSGLKYMLLFALVCGINTSLENQENVTSLILNDIGNQIENIANKTAEDILLELTKKIDDLEVSIVQDMLINEIKGEHDNLQTEKNKLSADLRGTLDNLLEIKEFQILNKTENDIEKLTSDNHKDLSNYEEFLKNMVDTEITNIHEAAINFTESIIGSFNRELHEILQNASTKNEPQSAVIPVAFTALLTSNVQVFDETCIIFDRVVTNVGLRYNTTVGTFTAPVKGLYVFSCPFLVNHGYVNAQLVKNGHEVGRGYGAKDTREGSGFINLILNLAKDDWVCVKVIPAWSTGLLRGDLYSSFSGFLVGKVN